MLYESIGSEHFMGCTVYDYLINISFITQSYIGLIQYNPYNFLKASELMLSDSLLFQSSSTALRALKVLFLHMVGLETLGDTSTPSGQIRTECIA